jgi:hypothetical protein
MQLLAADAQEAGFGRETSGKLGKLGKLLELPLFRLFFLPAYAPILDDDRNC